MPLDCQGRGVVGDRVDGVKLRASLTSRFSLSSLVVVVSERLEEKVQMCEIRSEIYGASDHCPVVLELAGPL